MCAASRFRGRLHTLCWTIYYYYVLHCQLPCAGRFNNSINQHSLCVLNPPCTAATVAYSNPTRRRPIVVAYIQCGLLTRACGVNCEVGRTPAHSEPMMECTSGREEWISCSASLFFLWLGV